MVTVKLAEAESSSSEPSGVNLAVMVAVPAPVPVAVPFATVAMLASLEAQVAPVTVCVATIPFVVVVSVRVNAFVSPYWISAVCGSMARL